MNLDAVRAALLADARADADAILALADRDVGERARLAQHDADTLLEVARAEGERTAAERLARQRGAAHREAREIVLRAQRRALDQLRERARGAVRELGRAEDSAALIDRLRALALAQLGPDAVIETGVDGEPGLVATDGRRRVDYRLATLADRAVDELGADVATAWS